MQWTGMQMQGQQGAAGQQYNGQGASYQPRDCATQEVKWGELVDC